MGKFLLFFNLFIVNIALCQVNDNFSDGDFTQNPAWQADATTNFAVNNGQLQSNSTTANSSFYISTENSLASACSWEFDVNLKFATSGNNYVDVYLISNNANLKSTNLNGYFVRIGDTSDEVSLYKRSGTTSSSLKLIDGRDGSVYSSSNNNFKFRISRGADGLFTLERDSTGTGNNFVAEGTVLDNTFASTVAFGFYVQQSTASFFQKHFFDNILIKTVVPDTTPPSLAKTSVASDGKQLTLDFDEALDALTAKNTGNYLVMPGSIVPTDATVNGSAVVLSLGNQLGTGTYTLNFSGIKDLKGNVASAQTASFTYKRPYLPKYNDIVINEIFPDPSPQIDLPTSEFVELWNRSNEDISLKGFKYKDAASTYTFADDSIKAGEYVILCAMADVSNYLPFGRVIGLGTWPSLNNGSDSLKLLSPSGDLISAVNHQNTWYKDENKRSGGWTLELIDPESFCKPSQNYTASVDASGGTPGRVNSTYLSNKTLEPLQLVSVALQDSVTLILTFNRGLDSLQASLPSHYNLNNGIGEPAVVTPIAPNFNLVELSYAEPLGTNKTYSLTVNNLNDCGTAVLAEAKKEFIVPGKIEIGDVLISEILFNPKAGGVDFVEIYNASDKILDFKDLRIATLANNKDSLVSIKAVSSASLFFEPKTYWVLSANPDSVKAQYFTAHPNRFVKLASLPAFADDKGVVVLLNREGKLEQFAYNKNMHFALLKDVEGVSLERVSFIKPTDAAGNFRSATAASSYATPADENSQRTPGFALSNEAVFLPSKSFSPDNDGFEDLLTIHYKFAEAGKVANVSIYDDQGKQVKKLVSNQTLNADGQWVWDGFTENNRLAKTGIYVFYIEIFELNGRVEKFKKTAVLASKLN
ncbi:hypothetical protein BCY91_14940 [Pelobium manganitolerans]|uniref:LTD domain-containing protein n=1 Tax=Pelobium manganitolerans TaxID=1842495 RepID=A0A419S9F8_9SPHI|nr:lamin tail domain-containing protein [Pelobium manganitolerans]RKD18630.1 hypothetical protein BCY91_14940 [Pelobium manganitolerans]